MRLLLLGCTGFIGEELVPRLIKAGHHLIIVSRQVNPKFNEEINSDQIKSISIDPSNPSNWEKESIQKAVKESEGIINLAGEPIAEKRWTQEQCKKIETSRINTTSSLISLINRIKYKPKVIINASAIGFYGSSQDQKFNEESPSGKDFLANICKKWESVANPTPKQTRLLVLRIGIVLGSNGGALKKMLPVFKAGLGGPIGNGQQWMSWIHRTDLCRIIEQGLMNQSWSGTFNCVSPSPIKMNQFAKELGKCLGRPSLLKVPGPLLKLILGDGAKVVLEGQYVISNKLKNLDFKFQYPDLNQALSASTNQSMK